MNLKLINFLYLYNYDNKMYNYLINILIKLILIDSKKHFNI